MRYSRRCATKWGQLDFLVHAIGFSDKNELKGRYADTTRANFSRTMVISCFSFTELAKRAAELMPESGGSMITLTFDGSMRVMPNYNVMGVAKAALEASVRYLAADFGPRNIRVNAVSAGPIRTLAGSGISDARAMFAFQQKNSPLGRGVTLEELGGSALYLLSDLSGGVTGEIHYVDSGYNIISMPRPETLKGSGSRSAACKRSSSPRRGIQYAAAHHLSLTFLEYWVTRAFAVRQFGRGGVTTGPRSFPRAGTPGAPRIGRYRRRTTAAAAPS